MQQQQTNEGYSFLPNMELAEMKRKSLQNLRIVKTIEENTGYKTKLKTKFNHTSNKKQNSRIPKTKQNKPMALRFFEKIAKQMGKKKSKK